MVSIEQRIHPRYPLVRPPEGEFQLLTPTARYAIKIINNISSFGIRIYIDVLLAERLKVAVEFTGPQIKLAVNGTVAWCAAREENQKADGSGRFLAGIQLFSPMLLTALSGAYQSDQTLS